MGFTPFLNYPTTSDDYKTPEKFFRQGPRYFVGEPEHACCYGAGIYDGHDPEFHGEGSFIDEYARWADVWDKETAQWMCDLMNADESKGKE